MSGQDGQATVEVIGLVPLLTIVVLAASQLLTAGLAREQAGVAAQAAAMALLQQEDPRAAAHDAVPGWARGRVDVRRRGSRVTVRLRPRVVVPGLADLLVAEARADAGRGTGG